jgi:hypothetical protein
MEDEDLSEIEKLNNSFYNYLTAEDDLDFEVLESDYKTDMKIDIPRETSLGIRKYDSSLDSNTSMKSPKNCYNSSPTLEVKRVYVSKNLIVYIYLIVPYLENFIIFNSLLKKFNIFVSTDIKLNNYKIISEDINTTHVENLSDKELLTDGVQKFIIALISIKTNCDSFDMYNYEFDNNTRYVLCEYWDNEIEINMDMVLKFLEMLMSTALSNIFRMTIHMPYTDSPLMNNLSYHEDLFQQNFSICRDLIKTVFEYCMIFDTFYSKSALKSNKMLSYIISNINIETNEEMEMFKKSCKFKHFISIKFIYCILHQMEDIKSIEKIKIENLKKFFYLIRSPLFYILFKVNGVLKNEC